MMRFDQVGEALGPFAGADDEHEASVPPTLAELRQKDAKANAGDEGQRRQRGEQVQQQ